MVAKARNLVAAYTKVSRTYSYLFFAVWCMTCTTHLLRRLPRTDTTEMIMFERKSFDCCVWNKNMQFLNPLYSAVLFQNMFDLMYFNCYRPLSKPFRR